MSDSDNLYMATAIHLAEQGMESNAGGPFGAVVVDRDGKIIGKGYNQVTSSNDPTAHAEVVAIREACQALNSFQLTGCVVYTSCEPCPMCLGAIYWARPEKVFYASTREDAAFADFDDQFIYKEIEQHPGSRKIKFVNLMRDEGRELFLKWKNKPDKKPY